MIRKTQHRQDLDSVPLEFLEADAIGLDQLGLPSSACFVQLAPVREGLLDVQGTTAATAAAAAASAVSTIAAAKVVRQLVATRVLFVQLAVRRVRQVELGAHLSGERALERLEHHPRQHRHIDQHDALDAHGVAANVQRGELELGAQRHLPHAPARVSQRRGVAVAQSDGKGRTLL
eukprot:scaffold48817_cov72-Phaeocystis_antarctica.AAC.2